ncbi:GIY-YIG nuclease family protein [Afipia massiliensis]|uniref:GIY-YIG nuclease family protein n=1 Tax=Afipia massiliensis TaxID=211460 RepID=UPI003D31DE7F
MASDGGARLHSLVRGQVVLRRLRDGGDLAIRVNQHNQRYFPGYTHSRRPVELAWSQYFDRITDAIAAERQIKGWGPREEAGTHTI